jgi:glycosyltransferase involved in cell wall biosynthesis
VNRVNAYVPLISIVLATYNSEKVIEKTLKSIIEQARALFLLRRLARP